MAQPAVVPAAQGINICISDASGAADDSMKEEGWAKCMSA